MLNVVLSLAMSDVHDKSKLLKLYLWQAKLKRLNSKKQIPNSKYNIQHSTLNMTMQEATFGLLKQLRSIYNENEAGEITDWVLESVTGSKKAERMLYKHEAITEKEELLLKEYTQRLLQHEPVQYILQEAWFYRLKFYVDPNVLIPRPETEELVHWVISENTSSNATILDIGTGSGCIAVAIKKHLKEATIWACDISKTALEVAKKNAVQHGVEINFIELDFLDSAQWKSLPVFDIIVSNPPYIPGKDAAGMQPNVLQYEPGNALFVADDDAGIFYKAIAEFGVDHLHKNGSIYCEIHEGLGIETREIFSKRGYSIEDKRDMQGKDRMIKATNT